MGRPSLLSCKTDDRYMTEDVSFSLHGLCAVRAAPQEPDVPGGRAFLSAALTACHVQMEKFLIQPVMTLLTIK